jgi:hypothetical protein
MTEILDHPFNEVCHDAEQLIENGATVFQKFSCTKCGQRLTIEEPNVFYKSANCDKCGTVTDIAKQGCNYLLVL